MSTIHLSESEKLSRLYDILPPKQRHRLMEQAERYAATVESLIVSLLPVRVEAGDEGYTVSDDVVGIYGTGPSTEEAMADYQAALLDCYESLLENEGQLSDTLQKRLDILKHILDPEEQD
jgi:hypothetical protein